MPSNKKKALTLAPLAAVGIALLLNAYVGYNSKPVKANVSSPISQEATISDRQDAIVVTDGDTIRIGTKRIRLWGVDAPELNQTCFKGSTKVACGEAAKVALMGIIQSGEVTCQQVDIDRYKREVSRCMAGDKDVAGWMVLMGWAFDYPQYSKGYYKDWEEESRTGNHGIWALKFDKPSEWRKGTRHY